MSGAPASGSSSGGGGEDDDDDADDEPEEAMPEATPPPLPTASRGYSAPGRSPASTTAAGAIVPTVVEGIFCAVEEREREKRAESYLSLPSASFVEERSDNPG